MSWSSKFIDLLACPETGESLCLNGENLESGSGSTQYPLVGGVPWLLANPRSSLVDWGNKLNHFQQILLSEIKSLEGQCANAHELVRPRLMMLLEGKKEFLLSVTTLFQPLVSTKVAPLSVYSAYRNVAPSTQNLLSYEANLYRDWIWGEKENTFSCDLVSKLVPASTKKLCVLGAGACRLALDLHKENTYELTVATDINPLFLLAVEKLLNGENFDLMEFPFHPKNSKSVAVKQYFEGIKERPENFYLAFSDAASPSFKKSAFDTVVTPWLIDIQPYELQKFLSQINHYIPIGGAWVNFGSLVFNQNRDSYCYSVDEIKVIAATAGFDIQDIQEGQVEYLCSPHNAGHRVETVYSWVAIKTNDCVAMQNPQFQDEWLLDASIPIPRTENIENVAIENKARSFLLDAVDGEKTLSGLSSGVAKEFGLEEENAEKLVREFLVSISH